MQEAHIYSPEVLATAAAKRADHVLALACEVEAGRVSKVAAKLALAAGGYDPDFGELIDALEVQPSPLLSDECATRLHAAAEPGETIVDVLDRLMAGADDGAEVVP